jgi:hypothetical protein
MLLNLFVKVLINHRGCFNVSSKFIMAFSCFLVRNHLLTNGLFDDSVVVRVIRNLCSYKMTTSLFVRLVVRDV